MSGALCPKFPKCLNSTNQPELPHCDQEDCPGKPHTFFHMLRSADVCDHDFRGWRQFADGNGGEQVCAKCGMGAMEYTIRTGE